LNLNSEINLINNVNKNKNNLIENKNNLKLNKNKQNIKNINNNSNIIIKDSNGIYVHLNDNDINENNININKDSCNKYNTNTTNSTNKNVNKEINNNASRNKRERENQNEEQKNKKIKSFNIRDILESNLSLLSNLQEPRKYNDIFNKVDKNKSLIVLNDELLNMKNLNVYEFVKSIQKNTNLVSAKWVFKYKYNSDNTINKRKARLVARGFTQKQGIEYNKTFSPTLKSEFKTFYCTSSTVQL